MSEKSIKLSIYYYNKPFSTWENLPYFEAIKVRRDLAKDLFFQLYKEQEESPVELPLKKRMRLKKVEKAWKDNQRLIDEKEGLI